MVKLFDLLRLPGCCFAALLLAAQPTAAQTAPPPAAQGRQIPDGQELTKLIWSTMIAVDQANKSGNYSVLRDIAAPGFQANNDPAKLGQIFSNLRSTGIDLSNTLLIAPTLRAQPAFVEADIMRVQGYFGSRPVSIEFDLYFQPIGGMWRIFGVSITPVAMSTGAPAAPAPAPAPAPTKPPKR